MICPYCNSEMEKGLLQSNYEISWLPGEKRRLFNNADFIEGLLSFPLVLFGEALPWLLIFAGIAKK